MAFKKAPVAEMAEDADAGEGGRIEIIQLAEEALPEGTKLPELMDLLPHALMAALGLAILLAIRRIVRQRKRQRILESMAEELDAKIKARRYH